ncbi:MAG: LOG family protein [Opitutales bacterium]
MTLQGSKTNPPLQAEDLAEFTRPGEVLARLGVEHTVAFFGSAVIRAHAPADRADTPPPAYAALAPYLGDAETLAALLTGWEGQGPDVARQYVVCTGGGPGIMEAASRGARRAGGFALGHTIKLPHEPKANPFIAEGWEIHFRHFSARKHWFYQTARALVVFPGGLGTLDEWIEFLVLRLTGKLPEIPALVYGRAFWEEILNLDALVRQGLVSERVHELFEWADTPEEAFAWLKRVLPPITESEA